MTTPSFAMTSGANPEKKNGYERNGRNDPTMDHISDNSSGRRSSLYVSPDRPAETHFRIELVAVHKFVVNFSA